RSRQRRREVRPRAGAAAPARDGRPHRRGAADGRRHDGTARRRRRPPGERLLMPPASIVFLTPLAALVALAMLLPLAAFVIAERRAATVRRLLSLRPPRTGVDLAALVALAAVIALLALAAAQPALSNTETQRVRTDASALFVVDISESMAASSGASGRTR